jgi:hypothetical protein
MFRFWIRHKFLGLNFDLRHPEVECGLGGERFVAEFYRS